MTNFKYINLELDFNLIHFLNYQFKNRKSIYPTKFKSFFILNFRIFKILDQEINLDSGSIVNLPF